MRKKDTFSCSVLGIILINCFCLANPSQGKACPLLSPILAPWCPRMPTKLRAPVAPVVTWRHLSFPTLPFLPTPLSLSTMVSHTSLTQPTPTLQYAQLHLHSEQWVSRQNPASPAAIAFPSPSQATHSKTSTFNSLICSIRNCERVLCDGISVEICEPWIYLTKRNIFLIHSLSNVQIGITYYFRWGYVFS